MRPQSRRSGRGYDRLVSSLSRIAVVCGALIFVSGCSTPNTVGPSARPTASASGSSSVLPSPSASGAFAADELVEATVAGLRLREAPGTGGKPAGTLAAGAVSIVVDGPQQADGYDWYLVSGLSLPQNSGCATGPDSTNPWTCPVWLGWVASASLEGDPWLRRSEPECADPAGPLNEFVFQQRHLYIACYRSQPLTFRGWLVVQVGVPLQEPCPDVPEDLRWLGCTGMYQLVDTASSSGPGLLLAVDKAVLPGDDPRTEVTGHYDDPAARNCTYGDRPQQSILWCRSQFVVDSAKVDAS